MIHDAVNFHRLIKGGTMEQISRLDSNLTVRSSGGSDQTPLYYFLSTEFTVKTYRLVLAALTFAVRCEMCVLA